MIEASYKITSFFCFVITFISPEGQDCTGSTMWLVLSPFLLGPNE